jgi:hypothetical protein
MVCCTRTEAMFVLHRFDDRGCRVARLRMLLLCLEGQIQTVRGAYDCNYHKHRITCIKCREQAPALSLCSAGVTPCMLENHSTTRRTEWTISAFTDVTTLRAACHTIQTGEYDSCKCSTSRQEQACLTQVSDHLKCLLVHIGITQPLPSAP